MQVRELALSTLALTALLTAGSAAAQYQWRDDRGAMTFSDRPPPTSVRPADVVRHPGMRAAAHDASAGASRPSMPPPAAASTSSNTQAAEATASKGGPGATSSSGKPVVSHGTPTVADRELAFRKRQLERAQAERKLAEHAEQLERQARACEDARAHQRTLESGMRLAQVDAQGEREFLSEQARAQRLSTLRRDVQEHCKAG